MLHKNSQKHYQIKGAIYFITTVTKKRFPYFGEDLLCELFIEELKLCKRLKKFELYGFVILPDHVHLLIKPSEQYNISEIMRSLKANFSRNVNRVSRFNEGDVTSRRLQACPDAQKHVKKLFYDKRFQNKELFFQWQKSFHDHIIRDQEEFDVRLRYIWQNPQKHCLTDDWQNYQWSSFKK